MQILGILWRNARRQPRTRTPFDRVPAPAGFRGALAHDGGACTACGTCSYVCSPGAIEIQARGDAADWTYFAGQCTFCGRCADYCPTKAIAFGAEAPPVTRDRDSLRLRHEVKTQPCARCGRPVTPLPKTAIGAAWTEGEKALPDARGGLCARCRRRLAAELLAGVSR